jgi:hypothetical protein
MHGDSNVKFVTLPVILYGCEAWSLTLREEQRLSVFQNRVLRKMFGPKRDEVTGQWRRLCYKLYDLCSSPNIIQACGTNGRQERCIQGLVGRPEGKRLLGRPRCRWEDNIKMDLQDVGWGGGGGAGTGFLWVWLGKGGWVWGILVINLWVP